MAVTSDLTSVRIHWLVVSLYSILVVQWPNRIMLPGLLGSCFGKKYFLVESFSMIELLQRPRNLKRG